MQSTTYFKGYSAKGISYNLLMAFILYIISIKRIGIGIYMRRKIDNLIEPQHLTLRLFLYDHDDRSRKRGLAVSLSKRNSGLPFGNGFVADRELGGQLALGEAFGLA